MPPVIFLQVFIIFNILLAKQENLSKICGMSNFDAHLEQQLNQHDADEAASVAETNAENLDGMCSELARLESLIQDLPYAKNRVEHSEQIAEVAKLIASYAEAIQ